MIQAEIGDDAVDPRVEGTLETEAAQIFVGLEEGLLINVLGVRFRSRQVQRQPQNRLIVMTHQHFEGRAVALLRLPDQARVVNAVALRCQGAPHIRIRRGVLVAAVAVLCRPPRTGNLANRNCDCVRIGRHCLSLSPTSDPTSTLHRNRRGSSPNVSRLSGVGPWFAGQWETRG